VASDIVAFGALRALREAGRRVPADVSVVGFDDIPLAAFRSTPHDDPTARQRARRRSRQGARRSIGRPASKRANASCQRS